MRPFANVLWIGLLPATVVANPDGCMRLQCELRDVDATSFTKAVRLASGFVNLERIPVPTR